jgi:hypothetical protein
MDGSQARLAVNVDTDVSDATLQFVSPVTIPFEVDGKAYDPDTGFILGAIPMDDRRGAGMFEGPENLMPGRYLLYVPEAFGQPPFRCVESFSAGDVKMDGNFLLVEESREYTKPISIKTGTACGSLTMKWPANEDSTLFIVLVPTSMPMLPRKIETGGRPHLMPYGWPLSPGDYLVYTFTNLDGLGYEDPRVLSQYHGQPLTVSAGQTSQIMLEVIDRNQ